MDMEARMTSQPPRGRRALMRAGIIQDQVQVERRVGFAVQALQKLHEFFRPLACVTFANDDPVEDAQRREQRRGAVPPIIVRLALRQARLQRQQRPRAIQRLNVRLGVTQNTTALSGGFRYKPTTSRSFSTKRGSFENLKRSTRCGCRRCCRQILRTIASLTPCARASCRLIQCVALGGRVVSVALTMAAIFSDGTGRRPGGRDASVNNAAIPPDRYRFIHRYT